MTLLEVIDYCIENDIQFQTSSLKNLIFGSKPSSFRLYVDYEGTCYIKSLSPYENDSYYVPSTLELKDIEELKDLLRKWNFFRNYSCISITPFNFKSDNTFLTNNCNFSTILSFLDKLKEDYKKFSVDFDLVAYYKKKVKITVCNDEDFEESIDLYFWIDL